MAQVTSYKPGSFSWFELATTDQPAAKTFYSKLFGWGFDDQPMGPDTVYTMLTKDGKHAAALYGMDAEMQKNMPPHWNVYMTVENADSAVQKAESLGGKALMAPMDVFDAGRMAAIQDPTGAIFMVWQPNKHIGAGVIDEPNAFCWYELNTRDTAAAKNFYSNLFGWGIGGGEQYTEWRQDERSIGGMMEIQPDWGNVPPNWLPYVMVENADAAANRATELGAQTMMGPQDVPNMGRFAVIKDPQGAVFAVFSPAAKQ